MDSGEKFGLWSQLLEDLHMEMRERESAIELWIPGTCFTGCVKLCLAAQRCRLLTKPIMSGDRDVPDWRIEMIDSLSQRKRIRLVVHCEPHVAAAATIGYNSFHWILICWLCCPNGLKTSDPESMLHTRVNQVKIFGEWLV